MDKLTPSKIYKKVKNNEIGNTEALKLLESLLNTSDIESIRVDVIEYLGKISENLEYIDKIIESCLISDESEIVRFAAAKHLIENYSSLYLNPLLWTIQNEKSIFFFKHMLDLLESHSNAELKDIQRIILEKISKIYDLNVNDAKFVLDIDYLDYLKFMKDIEKFAENFNLSNEQITALIHENQDIDFKGLARVKTTKNGYITNLSLKDLSEIPQSICKLAQLEILEISYCKIQKIDTCSNLYSIKELKLANNEYDFIPEWIIEYVKGDLNNQKYITSGVFPSEAYVLNLIEVLTGYQCRKLLGNRQSNNTSPFYKLNEKGNIIGIYYSNKDSWLGIIPLDFCNLKDLKELKLNNQRIKQIPDSINNLESLEILDLRSNEINKISEKLIGLNNVKVLDFRFNNIEVIPEFIKKLKFLKV